MQAEWTRRPTASKSVVFIHGFLSSGDRCWRHANGCYWPSLLEGESDLEPLGIYVFTYRTDVFSGSYRLGDVVDALKEHMRLDGVTESRDLVFVCHSMGGIVARKYLVQRAAELSERHSSIGLFLIASPSLGSAYADWLSPLARLLGHSQADALAFVRQNEWLSELDRDFVNLKEADRINLYGKELIEDRFIVVKRILRRQVVEPFSGARYFGEPFKVPGADHFSIAKPEDRSAIQHRLLCSFLARDDPGEAGRRPRETEPVRRASKVAAPAVSEDRDFNPSILEPLSELGATPHSRIELCRHGETLVVRKRTDERFCDIEALQALMAAAKESPDEWVDAVIPRATWLEDGFLWEIQDHIDGHDLGTAVQQNGIPLTGNLLRECVAKVAGLLFRLRELGLAHRDINPHNLILTRSKRLRLVDWSFCAREGTRARPVAMEGFSSPLARTSSVADSLGDWYSLGATAYYLGTAELTEPGWSAPARPDAGGPLVSAVLYTGAIRVDFATDPDGPFEKHGLDALCEHLLDVERLREHEVQRVWSTRCTDPTMPFRHLGVLKLEPDAHLLVSQREFYLLPEDAKDVREWLALAERDNIQIGHPEELADVMATYPPE